MCGAQPERLVGKDSSGKTRDNLSLLASAADRRQPGGAPDLPSSGTNDATGREPARRRALCRTGADERSRNGSARGADKPACSRSTATGGHSSRALREDSGRCILQACRCSDCAGQAEACPFPADQGSPDRRRRGCDWNGCSALQSEFEPAKLTYECRRRQPANSSDKLLRH
jgi:hypothetical protein